MCPEPEPCDRYEPDWDAAERSGNLCWGMGATPPCIHCGQQRGLHAILAPLDTVDAVNIDPETYQRVRDHVLMTENRRACAMLGHNFSVIQDGLGDPIQLVCENGCGMGPWSIERVRHGV